MLRKQDGVYRTQDVLFNAPDPQAADDALLAMLARILRDEAKSHEIVDFVQLVAKVT